MDLLLSTGVLNPVHPRCGEEYADMVSGGDPAVTRRRSHHPHRIPTPYDGELAASDATAVEMGRNRTPSAAEWRRWQLARDAVCEKIDAFRESERIAALAC